MPSRHYRSEIDGLRALAIIPVILYHAGFPGFAGGYRGVDVFFVISGYLIAGIIHSELQRDCFSILRFYERRARRILPALFVVLLLSSIAGWVLMSPNQFIEFGQGLMAVSVFVSNVFFLGQSGYFAIEADINPLLHTWSLAVEEQFYILFPVLLIFLTKYGTRVLLAGLCVLGLVSLGLAEWTATEQVDSAFFMLHTRAWELLAGALLATSGYSLKRTPGLKEEALAGLGFGLCIAAYVLVDPTIHHPGLHTIVPVLGAVLVIAFGTGDTITGKFLSLRPMVFIGLISYSLYLYHQPVFAFIRISKARALESPDIFFAVLVCLALSYLTWRFIEQPFRNRQIIFTRQLVYASVVFTLLPFAAGAAVFSAAGFPVRTNKTASELLEQIPINKLLREQGIRIGECQYNGNFVKLEKFLPDWDCLPVRPDPAILTYGDSHSADKAWAMRLAGIKIGNLGGAGCDLNPNPRTRGCKAILNKLVSLAKRGELDGIVLAQHWTRTNVSKDKMARLEEFWSNIDVPILLFSPMPEFANLELQIMKSARLGDNTGQFDDQQFVYDEELLSLTEGAARSLAKYKNITLIDSRVLFCGSRNAPCRAFDDGRLLLTDYAHLNPLGAGLFGKRIAANKVWQQWITAVKQQGEMP